MQMSITIAEKNFWPFDIIFWGKRKFYYSRNHLVKYLATECLFNWCPQFQKVSYCQIMNFNYKLVSSFLIIKKEFWREIDRINNTLINRIASFSYYTDQTKSQFFFLFVEEIKVSVYLKKSFQGFTSQQSFFSSFIQYAVDSS